MSSFQALAMPDEYSCPTLDRNHRLLCNAGGLVEKLAGLLDHRTPSQASVCWRVMLMVMVGVS